MFFPHLQRRKSDLCYCLGFCLIFSLILAWILTRQIRINSNSVSQGEEQKKNNHTIEQLMSQSQVSLTGQAKNHRTTELINELPSTSRRTTQQARKQTTRSSPASVIVVHNEQILSQSQASLTGQTKDHQTTGLINELPSTSRRTTQQARKRTTHQARKQTTQQARKQTTRSSPASVAVHNEQVLNQSQVSLTGQAKNHQTAELINELPSTSRRTMQQAPEQTTPSSPPSVTVVHNERISLTQSSTVESTQEPGEFIKWRSDPTRTD